MTPDELRRMGLENVDELREALKAGGYEGLYCTDERCGCGLDHLVACGEELNGDHGILDICLPGYKHTCIGEECAYPCDGYLPGREGDCYGPSKDGPYSLLCAVRRRTMTPEELRKLGLEKTAEVFDASGSQSIWGWGSEGHNYESLYAAVAELLGKFRAEKQRAEAAEARVRDWQSVIRGLLERG